MRQTAGWPTQAQALRACRVLFGPEVRLSPEFLRLLSPEGLKAAYRRMVLRHHPDRSGGGAAAFLQVREAYTLLDAYLTGGNGNGRGLRRPRGGSTGGGRAAGLFHRGPVPRRPLPLGLYLYYRGRVPYEAVLEALAWQALRRPRIGELAAARGWLTAAQVARVLRAARAGGRFGERAVTLGLLARAQVQRLLAEQQARQPPIGTYFVERRLLARDELEALARDQRRHNRGLRTGGPGPPGEAWSGPP
ncbi:J domain-containing protein [Dissulfurirhabdus thermomarina]|uniref:J domain-containing protein n=1 Tax=Dissulfurirhabdus thermomarina TaxID=1765737 RepID=A0A6N9TPJ9_DISTH|nr:J domain-containing protein [Dissulfurirhabdus thermomarina]NDY41664.1 J domain-containing protein [Dissulfurirhabdus thermomarina]NMX24356.1 J domain-containing protein [Dissulfurirhabdus thermomarina]